MLILADIGIQPRYPAFSGFWCPIPVSGMLNLEHKIADLQLKLNMNLKVDINTPICLTEMHQLEPIKSYRKLAQFANLTYGRNPAPAPVTEEKGLAAAVVGRQPPAGRDRLGRKRTGSTVPCPFCRV